MAHRRAKDLTQAAVASPKDLVRFGSSSNARKRAEAEWSGLEMVARTRKMCLSRAVCNFSRTGRMSEGEEDELDDGIGAVSVAKISSRSMASASAARASSVPVFV